MTQGELAEKISVKNKAVSRWETGKGYPDVTFLMVLGKFFGVSVNELLNGEKIVEETFSDVAEKNMTNLLQMSENNKKKSNRFVAGLCCVLAFMLLYTGISVGCRAYVSRNRTIKLFGEEYTEYDCLNGNFTPFYSDYCWYESDADRSFFMGLSYLKNDVEKNFIYYSTFIESQVFKKDSYELPEVPESDYVDGIEMIYNDGDSVKITNKDHIRELILFLSTFDKSADTDEKAPLFFMRYRIAMAEYFS